MTQMQKLSRTTPQMVDSSQIQLADMGLNHEQRHQYTDSDSDSDSDSMDLDDFTVSLENTNQFPGNSTQLLHGDSAVSRTTQKHEFSSQLSLLQQTDCDWKIRNLASTPFNCVEQIQAMNLPRNPHTFITVSLITENVKPLATDLESEIAKLDEEISIMKCTHCGSLLTPSQDQSDTRPLEETQQCDMDGCDIELSEGGMYFICVSCVKGDQFSPLKFCYSCVTREFILSSLKRKSHLHSYYEDFSFVEKSKQDSGQNTLINKCRKGFSQAFFGGYIQQGASLLNQDMQLKTKELGQWVRDENVATTLHMKLRAQISFWDTAAYCSGMSLSMSEEFEYDQSSCRVKCLHTVQVDSPLSINLNTSGNSESEQVKTQELIFMAEDRNRIFWFNEQADEIFLNELKLSDFQVRQIRVFSDALPVVRSYFDEHDHYLQKPRLYEDVICIQTVKHDVSNKDEPRYYTYFFDIFRWEKIFDPLEDVRTILTNVDQRPGDHLNQFWYLYRNKIMTIKRQKHGGYESSTVISDVIQLKRYGGQYAHIEGYIHAKGDRITLIVSGRDWHTYKLTDRQPREILRHERMDQTVVIYDCEEPGSLKLAGQLHQVKDEKIMDKEGIRVQNQYKMVIIDCNQPESPDEPEDKILASAMFFKDQQTLHFSLPSDLPEQCYKKLMPLVKVDANQYNFTLFYENLLRGQTNLIFVKGDLKQAAQNLRMIDPWVMPEFQFMYDHPILAYNDQSAPKRNRIFCVNLVKNQPQKRITLDMEVICFVHMTRDPLKLDMGVVEIHFLAMNDQNEMRLFKLTTNPWDSMNEDYKLTRYEMRIDFQTYNFNQIKKAMMIDMSRHELKLAIIVQLTNQVLALLDNNEINQLHEDSDEFKMSQIIMQIGLYNRCYYIRKSEREGDEIICIFYDETADEVAQRVRYAQKDRLLAIMVNHFKQPTVDQIQIERKCAWAGMLILDSNFNLKVLEYENQKRQTEFGRFTIGPTWSLAEHGVKRLMRALEFLPWNQCVLSEHGIMVANVQIVWQKQMKLELSRRGYIYSVDCRLVNGLPLYESDNNQFQCTGIHCVRGLAKTLTLNQEIKTKYNFFLISQSPTVRRVDLIKYKQAYAADTCYYALKSHILVTLQDKFLVFDQQTLMLKSINPGTVTIQENIDDEAPLLQVSEDQTQKIYTIQSNGTLKMLYDVKCIENAQSNRLYQALSWLEPHAYNNNLLKIHFNKRRPVVSRLITIDKFNNKNDLKIHKIAETDICVIQAKRDDISAMQVNEPFRRSSTIERLYNQVVLFYIHIGCRKSQTGTVSTLMTTNNYLIYVRHTIWIVDLSKIECYKNQTEVNLSDYIIAKPKVINLREMFEGAMTYNLGYSIHHVKQDDMFILCTAKREKNKWIQSRKDAIQITFKDQALIWDLEKNSEVQTLNAPSQFSDSNSYVRTGFQYYRKGHNNSKFLMSQCKFLRTNSHCNFISAPNTQSSLSECFKTFSGIELWQMMEIEKILIHKGAKNFFQYHISKNLYGMSINGETFFSLFFYHAKVLDIAYYHIQEHRTQIENFDLMQIQDQDSLFTRKIFYTLCLPYHNRHKDLERSQSLSNFTNFMKEKNQLYMSQNAAQEENQFDREPPLNGSVDVSFNPFTDVHDSHLEINKHNLCQWMILNNRPEFDRIIQLMLMSRELNLRTLIQHFDHFEAVFENQNENINEYMVRAFIKTSMSQHVTHLQWEPNQKMIVFSANSSNYSTKCIQDRANESCNKYIGRIKSAVDSLKSKLVRNDIFEVKEHLKPVEIRIIEVSWLNKRIPQFYKYLSLGNRPGIFDNELIKVLLQEQNYTGQIFKKVFLPYIVWMTLLLIYFMNIIPVHERPHSFFDMRDFRQVMLRIVIALLSAYLFYFETQQMLFLGVHYFNDIWNYGYILSLILDTYIIVEHSTSVTNMTEQNLIRITSLGSITLWLLLMYWMRLFQRMAFYVKMLTEIIYDLHQFMVLFVMILCTFATAYQIINEFNFNKLQEDQYVEFVREQTVSNFIDALMNIYLLGLGDFFFANIGESPDRDLLWFYIILALFMTNIVFLNMLIAIMGDTFNRLTDKRERNGMIQQTQLYCDFIQNLRPNKMLNNDRFLYIVTPVKDEAGKEAQDQWESGFTNVIEVLKKIETKLLEHQRKILNQEVKEIRLLQNQIEKLGKDLRKENNYLVHGKLDEKSITAGSATARTHDSMTNAAKLARLLGNSVTVESSLIDDCDMAVRHDPYLDLKRMIFQMGLDMNQRLDNVALNNHQSLNVKKEARSREGREGSKKSADRVIHVQKARKNKQSDCDKDESPRGAFIVKNLMPDRPHPRRKQSIVKPMHNEDHIE